MSSVVIVGLPVLIILAMTIVGLELTVEDLHRVFHYPAEVATGLLGQVLALPLIAAGLIFLLHPEPPVSGGLILAAAAPQAMISNYYCLLGRGNVALSVTLTGASSLLALASTPLIAGLAFGSLLQDDARLTLPVGKVAQQVVAGLLLPVGAGMLVRRYAPAFVERNRTRFQRLTFVTIAVTLAIILFDQAAMIQRHLASIVIVAVVFTASATALGMGIARALSWSKRDTVTLIAAFPSRSLSIATLIAVNVLGRIDFLAFAGTFFLVQAALLIPLMLLVRPATVDT